eukprot:2604677-Prymnesium_polylepis.1
MPPCRRAPSRQFTCGHRRTSAARAVRCLECGSSERPNLSWRQLPPVRHYSSVSRLYAGAAH